MSDFFSSLILTDADFLKRILLAVVLGFVIGIEREMTNKSAGLRTNILVCIGSCLFTILSLYGFSNALSVYPMGDPARVAAQILTGIGFIGGGTVLRHGTSVFGLTTAATLWVTASVGMACGCGRFDIAVICTVFSVATLTLIRIFEKQCIPQTQKNNRDVKISVICTDDDYHDLTSELTQMFPEIQEMSKKDAGIEKNQTKITLKLQLCCKNVVEYVFDKLKDNSKILSISVKELIE